MKETSKGEVFLKKMSAKTEEENKKNDDIVKNVVRSKRIKRDKYFFVSKPGL